MQNQFLLEELRLLQQRRQQQQDLLQQQMMQQLGGSLSGVVAAATVNQHPLSLLGNLSSLATPAPANPSADALLLRVLRGGGAPVQAQATINSNAENPTSNLLGAGGSSLASALGGSRTIGMSNEELLRKVAAAGLLGSAQNPTLTQPAALSPATAAAATLPSLLNSLVTADLDRKRQASTSTPVQQQQQLQQTQETGPSPKRQKMQDDRPASKSPPAFAAPTQLGFMDPAAAAVNVLASAAVMAMQQGSASADPSPHHKAASARGNRFPLPPKHGKDKSRSGILGMPKLTSFHKAWDNVKTKGMQKEIFLRKLHEGKMLSLSSSAAPKASQRGADPASRTVQGRNYQAV